MPPIFAPIPAIFPATPSLPSLFPHIPTSEKALHNLRIRPIRHLKTTFVNIFDKVGRSMEKLLPSRRKKQEGSDGEDLL